LWYANWLIPILALGCRVNCRHVYNPGMHHKWLAKLLIYIEPIAVLNSEAIQAKPHADKALAVVFMAYPQFYPQTPWIRGLA
jgi:hypothetical protein